MRLTLALALLLALAAAAPAKKSKFNTDVTCSGEWGCRAEGRCLHRVAHPCADAGSRWLAPRAAVCATIVDIIQQGVDETEDSSQLQVRFRVDEKKTIPYSRSEVSSAVFPRPASPAR